MKITAQKTTLVSLREAHLGTSWHVTFPFRTQGVSEHEENSRWRSGATRWLAPDRSVKRLIDLVGGLMLVIIFAPLLGLVALIVRLESPGPIIFRQQRLGRFGRPFTIYKFRTMKIGTEGERRALADLNERTGPVFKIKQDPRHTRVGGWLRKMSLDELPNLFNVVKAEMSLVGPRPPLPEEVAGYEDWHRRRLEAMPGMTGLWQISGRSELSFDRQCELDLFYIDHWSLWLDLRIIMRTIPAVLLGRGAC